MYIKNSATQWAIITIVCVYNLFYREIGYNIIFNNKRKQNNQNQWTFVNKWLIKIGSEVFASAEKK